MLHNNKNNNSNLLFKNKKGINSIVAVTLLIVIAVLSILGFQKWFSFFSSNLYNNAETDSSSIFDNFDIQGIYKGKLYLKLPYDANITQVKIGNVDCNITNISLNKGINKIDVASCLNNNLTTNTPEIVVVTDKGIAQEKEFVDLNNLPKVYNCYTQPAGEIGRFPDCEGMLIVDRAILDNAIANNPINSREDFYITYNNTNYTFGYSEYNIFTGQVTDMNSLFRNQGNFNANINYWDVSNVQDMFHMFDNTDSFNQSLNNWDVSSVKDMSHMFEGASSFNQPLNNWDVSNVQDMNSMFYWADSFNQPLNNWDVSSVTNMGYMFYHASFFNQSLNNWNVSNVCFMWSMFKYASSFNQPLDNWDVSNVGTMSYMFEGASSFNQSLNSWNVSNVNSMRQMFASATSFNQPLDKWNVSSVTNMIGMFGEASSFNQNLSMWDVDQVTSYSSFDYNTPSWTLPKPTFIFCPP